MEVGRVGRLNLAHGVQQAPDEEGVPQRAHHSEHEDGPQVLHELPDGQEVAGIQDDGRQQAKEEQLGVQHWRDLFPGQFDEPPH